jgi:hypothetical protein
MIVSRVATDEEGWTWWFTEAGVARAEELDDLR